MNESKSNGRALRKALAKENAKQSDALTPVDRSRWPSNNGMNHPPYAVWRSKKYLVQAYAEKGGVVRLSIIRTVVGQDGNWIEDISWDELQSIKRQIGMGDWFAVECFPRDEDVVNVSNMRHLWILPEPLYFAWRKAS